MFTLAELEELRMFAKKAHKEILKGEGTAQGDYMISISNSYLRMLDTLALNVRNRQVEDSVLVLMGVKKLEDLDGDDEEEPVFAVSSRDSREGMVNVRIENHFDTRDFTVHPVEEDPEEDTEDIRPS